MGVAHNFDDMHIINYKKKKSNTHCILSDESMAKNPNRNTFQLLASHGAPAVNALPVPLLEVVGAGVGAGVGARKGAGVGAAVMVSLVTPMITIVGAGVGALVVVLVVVLVIALVTPMITIDTKMTFIWHFIACKHRLPRRESV